MIIHRHNMSELIIMLTYYHHYISIGRNYPSFFDVDSYWLKKNSSFFFKKQNEANVEQQNKFAKILLKYQNIIIFSIRLIFFYFFLDNKM